MTRLILILSLFISTSASARGNWMSEADIAKANAGQHDVTTYRNRGKCSRLESPSPCHDITGKNLRRESVQDLQMDDLTKPLFGLKLKTSGGYDDLKSCQADMPSHCDDQSPGYAVRPICAKETDPAETFELYCIAEDPQGYEKKTERRLVPDASLEAADDQRKADKAARNTALDQINSRLLQCARANLGSVTPAQVAQCMKAIAKQLVKTQLQLNEL